MSPARIPNPVSSKRLDSESRGVSEEHRKIDSGAFFFVRGLAVPATTLAKGDLLGIPTQLFLC
jgi:hypothetical protein